MPDVDAVHGTVALTIATIITGKLSAMMVHIPQPACVSQNQEIPNLDRINMRTNVKIIKLIFVLFVGFPSNSVFALQNQICPAEITCNHDTGIW